MQFTRMRAILCPGRRGKKKRKFAMDNQYMPCSSLPVLTRPASRKNTLLACGSPAQLWGPWDHLTGFAYCRFTVRNLLSLSLSQRVDLFPARVESIGVHMVRSNLEEKHMISLKSPIRSMSKALICASLECNIRLLVSSFKNVLSYTYIR